MARNLKAETDRLILCHDALMSLRKQAKSIRVIKETQLHSFWKRFPKHAPGAINGMPYEEAVFFAPHVPYLYTDYMGGFKLALWVDIDDMASKSLPIHVRESIAYMAKFQCWLHQVPREMLRIKICEILTKSL